MSNNENPTVTVDPILSRTITAVDAVFSGVLAFGATAGKALGCRSAAGLRWFL